MNERSKNKEGSKRDKKASTYRRVVAGNVNGSSVVQSDEQLDAYQFKTVPGCTAYFKNMLPFASCRNAHSESPIENQQCRGGGRVQCALHIRQLGLGERYSLAKRKQVALRS